jgi:alpha-galactosidase
MAFFQLEMINHGSQPIFIDKLIPLKIKEGSLSFRNSRKPDYTFYSNGWQSWSNTGTFRQGDKQHTTLIGSFQNPQIINPDTPRHKDGDHFSGDMFGLLCENTQKIGLLAGFISQEMHFGSLETALSPTPSLSMWANGDHARLDPGESIRTDWACLSFVDLNENQPLEIYLNTVAKANKIQSEISVPVGWCSWYHFYQNITQEDIEANLTSVLALKDRVPLPLLQIDDGFETYPGDWFDFVPGFPEGVMPLAKQISKSDLIPGLWLAPFIVHPKAKLVKEHPEWLLRDENGKLASAGFAWNTFTYALDLTHPEALDYACDVIRTAVKEWGFEYLKLDFLYVAALKGQYQDPTKTRAQVLRNGLEALRHAAGPDTVMLACGCPLGSALGLFDAMRIGTDVSGYWEPHFPPVSKLLTKEVNMPSARNALQNILTRAPLHRQWWINDPDCLLVRPDTKLNLPEVQSLATAIGMTGGSLLVSDDLPSLPEDRLRIAQVLLPVIDQQAQICDLFESHTPRLIRLDLENALGLWHLLAVFNWGDHPADLEFSPHKFNLPLDPIYWCREFWSGEIGKMGASSPFNFGNVPPHGVRVIAARQCQPALPTYLGSDIHLSQGLEIGEWEANENQISLRIDVGRGADGRINIYLPWEASEAWLDQRSCSIQSKGQGIYNIDLEDADGKWLSIIG